MGRHADFRTPRPYSPEAAAKHIRSAHSLGPVFTEDAKALGKEGFKHHQIAKKLTEEHKANISKAQKGNSYARSRD